MTDQINRPPHYTEGEIECIDAIKAAVKGLPAFEAVLVGHVIRYVWRYRRKHKATPQIDVGKAQFYLTELQKEIAKNDNN
jgi:hypothetical protein